MKFSIKNAELQELNAIEAVNFPKYTSQLINWANQNAQGTRPRIVGQMSELFPEFLSKTCNVSIQDWFNWYVQKYPDSIETATDKIYAQILNLKEAIKLIDRDMVHNWVEDLVINKTFNGLYVQKAILSKLAKIKGTTYRLACPEEESKGIDGFVGNVPYSVKADTYKTMNRLSEIIDVKMIYYTKSKSGLNIEVED